MHAKIGTNTRSDLLFNVFNYALMAIVVFVSLYPFYYILIYSISDPQRASNLTLLPTGFSLEAYRGIFMLDTIVGAFVVSIARTIIGTAVCVALSAMFAYLLTKREMFLRAFVYRLMIISMYVSAGLIPWYLTMNAYGLRNSFIVYVLPGAVNAFFVILVKTFIEQLPASLEESAMIDGAGFFRIFASLIFPLSKPIIATIAVFSSVGYWNSWQDNFFLVSDNDLQTLQLLLYNYLSQAELTQQSIQQMQSLSTSVLIVPPRTVQMCITMVVTLPILVVYPILQRYFVKGIMMGAIKA